MAGPARIRPIASLRRPSAPVIGYAWQLDLIDPTAGTNKFYLMFAIGNVTAVCYGRRGTAGSVSFKMHPSARAASGFAVSQVDRKQYAGYRMLLGDVRLSLPEGYELSGSTLHVAQEAFAVCWRRHWSRLDELARFDWAAPARHVVSLPGWQDRTRTWAGQRRGTLWGQLLAPYADATVHIDDLERDRTLLLAAAEFGRWLYENYEPTDTSDSSTFAQLAAAEPGDNAQVLATASQLWTPDASGPLSDLSAALEMARAVTG